jgi:hypothetical protein
LYSPTFFVNIFPHTNTSNTSLETYSLCTIHPINLKSNQTTTNTIYLQTQNHNISRKTWSNQKM